MTHLMEQRRRIQQSPQRWANDVVDALKAASPTYGLKLTSSWSEVEQGRPVLYVTYQAKIPFITVGLRRFLDTENYLKTVVSTDAAVWLAVNIIQHDLSPFLKTYPAESQQGSDEPWWWGDEPLPGTTATIEAQPIAHKSSPVYEETWDLLVNGQDFRVSKRRRSSIYNFDWLNGPHPYGFAFSSSSELSKPQMKVKIARFLAEIDPETGYIE